MIYLRQLPLTNPAAVCPAIRSALELSGSSSETHVDATSCSHHTHHYVSG